MVKYDKIVALLFNEDDNIIAFEENDEITLPNIYFNNNGNKNNMENALHRLIKNELIIASNIKLNTEIYNYVNQKYSGKIYIYTGIIRKFRDNDVANKSLINKSYVINKLTNKKFNTNESHHYKNIITDIITQPFNVHNR